MLNIMMQIRQSCSCPYESFLLRLILHTRQQPEKLVASATTSCCGLSVLPECSAPLDPPCRIWTHVNINTTLWAKHSPLGAAQVHSGMLCDLQPPYLVNSSSPWMTPTYQPPARYFHSPGATSPAGVNSARQAPPAAAAAYAAAWQQQQVCAVHHLLRVLCLI